MELDFVNWEYMWDLACSDSAGDHESIAAQRNFIVRGLLGTDRRSLRQILPGICTLILS